MFRPIELQLVAVGQYFQDVSKCCAVLSTLQLESQGRFWGYETIAMYE